MTELRATPYWELPKSVTRQSHLGSSGCPGEAPRSDEDLRVEATGAFNSTIEKRNRSSIATVVRGAIRKFYGT